MNIFFLNSPTFRTIYHSWSYSNLIKVNKKSTASRHSKWSKMNPIQKIHQTSKRTYIKDNNLTNKSPNPLKHKEPSSNPLKQNEPNSENSSNTQKIYIKDNNLIKQNSNPLKQNKLSKEKREREREREREKWGTSIIYWAAAVRLLRAAHWRAK